jgi:RNA polymerase sigma-70 factor (ECF subfamily)
MTVDWETILRDDGPAVWRTAWRVLGSDSDADECFQETFVAALEYAKSGRAVHHWRALLQRIATTRAIDRLRRNVSMRNREAELTGDHPSSSRSPDALLESAELSAALRRALGRLPQGQAEVFCLFHIEGWSYRDIAGEMSVTTDLVGVWLQRAKRRLRELLAGVDPAVTNETATALEEVSRE